VPGLLRPHRKELAQAARPSIGSGRSEARHRLAELRVNFVCGGHHSDKQYAEVDTGQTVLKRLRDTD
jgi:hypothetical protein